MKRIIPVVCLLIMLSACHKSGVAPVYTSQGTIIGYDVGACAICGGLEITIKNDPTTNPPPFYRVNNSASVPINLGPNPKFPINVDLDWRPDTAMHGGYFIIISRIKLLN